MKVTIEEHFNGHRRAWLKIESCKEMFQGVEPQIT